MPAPSPSSKTILEMVLWNGLQSCRCITPDVINVIKMPSFQYFLYLREQKKSQWGLDPVNRQGVPTQLFYQQLKSPSQTVPCEQMHCRARSMRCWQKVRVVSVFFTQPFQYFQIVNLVDRLSSWYKFIMNNPANIKFANFIVVTTNVGPNECVCVKPKDRKRSLSGKNDHNAKLCVVALFKQPRRGVARGSDVGILRSLKTCTLQQKLKKKWNNSVMQE